MITKKMFLDSRTWIKEATRCLVRAVILKRNYKQDYNGQIEALQHCFELACKSWYILAGKEYPKNHNPAKNIDGVGKFLYRYYPLFDDERFFGFVKWMKENSEYLSRLHETTIYGDESNNVPASQLFKVEEVGDLSIKVSAFWTYTYVQVYYFGSYFGYLSNEQKKEFLRFTQLMDTLKEFNTLTLNEEETKRLFPFLS